MTTTTTRGCQPSQKRMSRKPQRRKVVELGTHVDGSDDTAGYCVHGTCCGQVLEKPWTGALQKDSDAGHTLTAPHE